MKMNDAHYIPQRKQIAMGKGPMKSVKIACGHKGRKMGKGGGGGREMRKSGRKGY